MIVDVEVTLRLKSGIWICSILLEDNYYLANSSHEVNFAGGVRCVRRTLEVEFKTCWALHWLDLQCHYSDRKTLHIC